MDQTQCKNKQIHSKTAVSTCAGPDGETVYHLIGEGRWRRGFLSMGAVSLSAGLPVAHRPHSAGRTRTGALPLTAVPLPSASSLAR